MIGSLCSGYGGLEMAIDDDVAWHAENDPSASAVLAHHHPDTPNHGDLTAIDWATVEPVDVICAGFPCQPVSMAGQRKVTDDARWLWPHIANAVRVLRPRHVVLENVAGLLAPWRDGRRWAPAPVEEVIGDLAALRYVGSWRSVRASDVGAPHRRQRVFIVAVDADIKRVDGSVRYEQVRGRREEPAHRRSATANADVAGLERRDTERRRERPTRPGRVETATDPTSPTSRGPQQPTLGAPRRPTAEPRERPSANRWADYAGAIARWEHLTGRPAPDPTDNRRRLNARFVEWMMGLPDGWVTDVGLSRAAQLRILGNGVVPQQAAHALAVTT